MEILCLTPHQGPLPLRTTLLPWISHTTLLEFLFPFVWFLLSLAEVPNLFSFYFYHFQWATSLSPGLLGVSTLWGT